MRKQFLHSLAAAAVLLATQTSLSFAQESTWTGNNSIEWFDAGNWTAGVPVGPGSIAIFGDSPNQAIMINGGNWDAGELHFLTPGYVLYFGNNTNGVIMGSPGIMGAGATFKVSPGSSLRFDNQSNLSGSTIANDGDVVFSGGNPSQPNSGSTLGFGSLNNVSGSVVFQWGASMGWGNVVNDGNGDLRMQDNSSMGSATITNLGMFHILDSVQGKDATLVNMGDLDLSNYGGGTFSIGALSSYGTINLAGPQYTELQIGSLNQEDSLFGDIMAGSAGGAIVKVGSGTLDMHGQFISVDGDPAVGVQIEVRQGNLQLNGNYLSDGDITVYSGARISGYGSYAAGDVEVRGGGIFSTSDGSITLRELRFTEKTGKIQISLNASNSTSTYLDAQSDLFAKPVKFEENGAVILADLSGLDMGTEYLFKDVIRNVEDLNLANWSFEGTGVAAYEAHLVQSGNNIDLVVTVVPEPSTYALFAGIGGLGLALVSRRKRKA